MSTPDSPSIFEGLTELQVRFLSMPFTERMQPNDHMQRKIQYLYNEDIRMSQANLVFSFLEWNYREVSNG